MKKNQNSRHVSYNNRCLHLSPKIKPLLILPLLLVFFAIPAFSQISGTVTDNNGETLIGVNIIEKGTTNGTTTDIDGKYSIECPSDAILTFSYTGFNNQEVAIAGRSSIDVVMDGAVELDEIIVVGFGTQRKVDLTGAVGSISADEIAATPVLTADQALRGRLSGVQLSNRSGAPGSPINVRIRGVGTTGNNQPLWVVDGVPIVQTTNITVNTAANTESNPLVGINPSDIQSIDVLKDASAAAIYGARAANGVIIVTTKRGKEGRTSLVYDGYYGVQSVRKKLDVLDVAGYTALQSDLGRDFSTFSGLPFVDWQDEVFSQAGMQSHNMSASGGTENMNFNISGGYFKQDGIELATAFERYSVKANSDIKVGKRIKIGESLNISFTDRLVQSEPGRAPAFIAAQNAPFTEVFDESGPGGYAVISADNAGPAAGSTQQIVGLNDLSNNETRVNTRRILGSIYGELELAQGLKFKTQAGIDYSIGEGGWFSNIYNFGGASAASTDVFQVVSKPSELTTNIANTLTYTNNFDRGNLTVVLGHEETNFEFDRLRGQGRGFLSPSVTLVNTAANSSVGQEADQWALRGFLGRIAYSHDDKYLVTINGRLDATSRFADGNRSDFFPSVSVGWRLSEEDFLKDNSLIDEMKLRLAWGQSGNQFTGTNFAYLSTLGLTSLYPLGAAQTITAAPTPFVFANPTLKWEVSTQTGVGLDVSMMEGRVDFSVDLFQKETTDILVGVPISAVSGFLLPPDVNAGKVKNTGIEISGLYQNRAGKLGYNISANLTAVKNEVIELGDNETPIISGYFGAQTHRTMVGESIGHFYGYETAGLYTTQAELDAALPDESGTPEIGDIRFVDANGDGAITPLDRVTLGSPQPSVFYGVNLGFDYEGFDIGIFMQGASGLNVFNNVRRTMESMNGTANQFATVANRFPASNDLPRATVADPNNNNRFSDRWVEKADYLRLQNLQIGYTFDSEKIRGIGDGFFQGLRLYVSMTNLITLTSYSGLDPEVTRGFSFQKGEQPLASGQDDGFTPTPRIVQFGTRVSF